MPYRGDFWRIDDETGFKVRASNTARQWDNRIVRDPDQRNPQDYVRGRKDRQTVIDARPEPADVFVGSEEPCILVFDYDGGVCLLVSYAYETPSLDLIQLSFR
jgi:hypothetical protein